MILRTSLTRALTAIATAALLVALTACASTSTPAEPDPAASGTGLSGDITVFAAASLTATFTEIAAQFEEENPGTSVELSFAGSSDLVTQITEGAPADVFASADTKNMTKLTDVDLIEGSPLDFASNTLTIAVPPGNPANIESFADLAREGVSTVICAPQVPCGAATATIEEATGIDISPVSEESSVTDVLGKISSGQGDAGLVYVTDVAGAGDTVEGITFAESSEAVNIYPIGAVADSANAELAQAFVDYVTGVVGQRVLAAAGFGTP